MLKIIYQKVDTPDCEIYGTLDDVQQLLTECVKYLTQREALVRIYDLNIYDIGIFLTF